MLEDEEPDLEQLAREEFEDALVDGDVPFQRGTAQAALKHRNFRIVYFGVFASNIGTWMQNVVLGAYAFKLTGSAAYVGLVYFARAGSAAVPLDARGLARRRGRSPAVPGRRADRAARVLVRPRGHRARDPSFARADRDRGVRGRHRERARRSRPQRHPADARPPRGSPRRGRARVGADEPLPRHRADHRRRDLLLAQCGARVRHQRARPTCSR